LQIYIKKPFSKTFFIKL